jgi:murein DD-endopeptidase MepM/ murein hydrolase activator NlpD
MRGSHARLASALMLTAFAACHDEPPPPTPPPKKPEPPTKDAAVAPPPALEHTVEEGQTLWDIARAYDVSVDDIMKENDLDANDVRKLRKGAPLRIPGATEAKHVETAAERAAKIEELPPLKDGAYHPLARGESLWTLARTYDVPIETIMERNDFDDDAVSTLQIGQPIIIPGIKKAQIKKAAPTAAKQRDGITHTMQPGETVWDLAHAFNVSVAELMATNHLTEAGVRTLRDGTEIFIPGVEEDRSGRIRRRESARERRAKVVARKLGLGTYKAAKALLHGRIQKRWTRAAGNGSRLPGTLRWPVTNGWYVRGYGSGEGGYHLAVDIMGKIGWNVRAAAPGIVGYSGDEIRGYGNVVMVIHPGGWVTMYAHNSVNFAAAGEKVQRGTILAEVGSTGISRGPHVHFELIHAGKNCDPAPLMRPGVKHRSGKRSKIKTASWTNPDKRPVRCAPRRRHPRSRWVVNEDPTKEAESEPNGSK